MTIENVLDRVSVGGGPFFGLNDLDKHATSETGMDEGLVPFRAIFSDTEDGEAALSSLFDRSIQRRDLEREMVDTTIRVLPEEGLEKVRTRKWLQ